MLRALGCEVILAKKKDGKSKGFPEHYLKITLKSQIARMAKRKCISLEEAEKIVSENQKMASNRKPSIVKKSGNGKRSFAEKMRSKCKYSYSFLGGAPGSGKRS